MSIALGVREAMERASWIRKMFEQGLELKKKHGEENVYDFTLGNPVIEPPARLSEALRRLVARPEAGMHRYMPNSGYPEVREAIADAISKQQKVHVQKKHVTMTVGAASALNVCLKAILNPGDEVIIFAPYFPEYNFYVKNQGGAVHVVETDTSFQLDIEQIEEALNEKTKALILNSPNNPTGVIYSEDSLIKLAEMLHEHKRRYGKTVFVLSDEPYRKIVYSDNPPPAPLRLFDDVIMCTSHAKDLAIPGERIGYAVIGPRCEDVEGLADAMAFCIRTLGYVNAPALMQRLVKDLQFEQVDMKEYRLNRDLFLKGLLAAGYHCVVPEGAFYLFPRCPIEDDVAFVGRLAERRVLAVPGSGFGRKGHFRVAYCCETRTIKKALPLMAEVFKGFSSSKPDSTAREGRFDDATELT